MNRKKRPEKLNENPQTRITAAEVLTASKYLVTYSMDNIETMIKLLANNPKNLKSRKCLTTTETQRDGIDSTAPTMPRKFLGQEFPAVRALSADSLRKTDEDCMANRPLNFRSSEVFTSGTCLPSLSSIAASVFITGPVRIQTTQKIYGDSAGKFVSDELMELFSHGVKYPSKELISIAPKILKSSTASRSTPITAQSVKVGQNYLLIERKTDLQPVEAVTKIYRPHSINETVEFNSDANLKEEELVRSRKAKSDTDLIGAYIFNLIGPLVITASQNTVHISSGSYRIYEEIELRAHKSTAKPEISVTPFLRKVSESPRHTKQQIPFKYQEEIFVGFNVLLIKRLIEIKPGSKHQEVSFSETRTYVTDKSVASKPTAAKSKTLNELSWSKILQKPLIKSGGSKPVIRDPTSNRKLTSSLKSPNLSYRTGTRQEMKTAVGSAGEHGTLDSKRHALEFDEFRIIRSVSSSGSPEGIQIMKKDRKSTGCMSHTEAFMSADLLAAHSSTNTLTGKSISNKSRIHDIEAWQSKSLHTARSYSVEHVATPRPDKMVETKKFEDEHKRFESSGPRTPTDAFMKADLLTARAPTSMLRVGKSLSGENLLKQKNEHQKPRPFETFNSKSKIHKHSPFYNSPNSSTSRSLTSFLNPSLSPKIEPLTPQRSPREKRKLKRATNLSMEESELSVVPSSKDGLTSSSKQSTDTSSDSSENDEDIEINNNTSQPVHISTRGKIKEGQIGSEEVLNAEKNYGPSTARIISETTLGSLRSRFLRFPESKKFQTDKKTNIRRTSEQSLSENPKKELELGLDTKRMCLTSGKKSETVRSRFQRFPEQKHPTLAVPSKITKRGGAEQKLEIKSEQNLEIKRSPVSTKTAVPMLDQAQTQTTSSKLSAVKAKKHSSVMFQAKGEHNITVNLNINFRTRYAKSDDDQKRSILKPKRILIGSHEVYRENGIYQL